MTTNIPNQNNNFPLNGSVEDQENALENKLEVCAPALTILYQDEFIVAVDKPANMFVHRTYLNRQERYVILQVLRDQIGKYVYPLHRLDRATSGVLLFALDEVTARDMCELFKHHDINKEYVALVRGFSPDQGEVNRPLKEKLEKIAGAFSDHDKEPQSAQTFYQTLKRVDLPIAFGKFATVRYSLVALQPQTGRRHQLRRHMNGINHPIIGDVSHGDNKQNHFFKQHMGFSRLMLHASLLEFIHPVTKQKLSINSSPLSALTILEDGSVTSNYWQQVMALFD